jgi:general secretion pathway protein A
VTPPEPPARSLADDPTFVASLSDLDRGVTHEEAADVSAPQVSPAPPALAPRRAPAAPVVPDGRRRPLLELFPVDAPPGARPGRGDEGLDLPGGEPALTDPSAYERFYGLEERAFGLSSDPRFLYRTASHDRALADLLDAVRRRDSVVLFTGAAGLGKTTLCRALVEQLDRRTIAALVTHPFLSIEELLKTVLVDFGVIAERDLANGHLSSASHVELAGALHHFLCSLAPLGAFALIIIDDAQSIPAPVLDQIRVLSDVEREAHLLQIVLVGEPELATTLDGPECEPLAGRIGARAALVPLTRAEIDGYLAHRLAVAGSQTRASFDEGARDRLYELTGGVPGLLNQVCDGALESGYTLSARVIDRALVDRAAGAIGLSSAPDAPSAWSKAAMAGGLLLLGLLGAALAALLFRDRIEALLN